MTSAFWALGNSVIGVPVKGTNARCTVDLSARSRRLWKDLHPNTKPPSQDGLELSRQQHLRSLLRLTHTLNG
jgi:hypothetical protein